MVQPDYDLVILGGGCAGLSLGMRLAASNPANLRVAILEARDSYTDDRSWCFWAAGEHACWSMVSHQWSAWSFSAGSSEHVQSTHDNLSYQYIRAGKFYETALMRIMRDPLIDLRPSTNVEALSVERDRVLVAADGKLLTAKWVIDTRLEPTDFSNRFAQHFVGAEIEIDDDLFDPSTVGLMQDMSTDEFGFRFTYLLPFSRNKALVEETRFCREIDEDILVDGLHYSISQLTGGAGFRVLRREQGRIPMSVAPKPAKSVAGQRIWKAGTAAGAVRPSTGYAFLRIQNWAEQCASQLGANLPPVGHSADPSWRRAADALFLRVVESRPSLAPSLFMAMGSRVAPRTLTRFLSDQGDIRDFTQVVAALPKLPFLAELATPKLNWSRA